MKHLLFIISILLISCSSTSRDHSSFEVNKTIYFIDGEEVSQEQFTSVDSNEIEHESATTVNGIRRKKIYLKNGPGVIFDFAEVMPEYPEGINFLRKYVEREYKKQPNYTASETIVTTRLVIEKDGSVKIVHFLKGFEDCEECKAQIVEIIQNLPDKFSPGLQAGKPVRIHFILPLKLQ